MKDRLERVAFLQTLSERLTRPVMPDDEAFDYLITQAIADFLATQNEPRMDGIIFASAQSRKGRNVVLFHSAALVAPLLDQPHLLLGYLERSVWLDLHRLHTRPLVDPVIIRRFHIYTRSDRPLGPAAQCFTEYLIAHAHEHGWGVATGVGGSAATPKRARRR